MLDKGIKFAVKGVVTPLELQDKYIYGVGGLSY